MKILFISDLKGKVSSGMSWSVPARIAAQARIDDVLWVNLTEVSMPHWEATGVFHTIGEYGNCKMDVFPNGFSLPDLVVFEGVYYIKFVRLAKELRRTNTPYVIVPRSMLTHDAIHNGKYLKKAVANILFFNKFVRNALAIQYLTAKEYHDSGDGWNKRYIISPNGFDAPDCINRIAGKGNIRCTFIGRLDIYQKGLDLLVQACAKIQESLRNAHFKITLYGPDWHGSIDDLNRLIKENGLSEIIVLGGEIKGPAKAECLLASDLFIMTSRFEGMPMGLIEALAYSVPALLTPGTNMCDRIDSYDAGWTCGESAEDISKGLLKVIEQKFQLEEKGKRARELALKYNWNKIAEDFKHDIKQQLKDKENMNKDFLMSLAKLGGVIPDKLYLSLTYRFYTGRWINWKNPQRMSEKIQLYKAYYRNPEMLPCTDKYLVRDFVTKRLGTDKYLNELYQVCDHAEEIDFDKLPSQFVIKTTDGGSGNNIYVCKDKRDIDIPAVVKRVNSWRNKKLYIISREWAYKGAKQSRIVVEKFLEDKNNADGSINDYKFLCFDGKFRYLWVDTGRYSDFKRGWWDENLSFRKIHDNRPLMDPPIALPDNIQEMITLSEKLAAGFPHARIDWYNIGGKIIFGEITFYSWSGYSVFEPDSFDFEMGKLFNTEFKKK